MSGGFASLAALCNGQSVGASIAAYTSGGTSVPFSATANTKGAYTQLTAATAFDAMAVLIKVVYGNNTGPDTAVAVDIAVGASGSEVVVVPNLNLNDGPSGTTYSTMVMYSLIPLTIPAGTRVSARSASNGTSGTGIINVSMVFLDRRRGRSRWWQRGEGRVYASNSFDNERLLRNIYHLRLCRRRQLQFQYRYSVWFVWL